VGWLSLTLKGQASDEKTCGRDGSLRLVNRFNIRENLMPVKKTRTGGGLSAGQGKRAIEDWSAATSPSLSANGSSLAGLH
jgi:hypothetical protein